MALNKLKKWIGTQAMTAFFDQLNDNVDATNAAIDAVETNNSLIDFSSSLTVIDGVENLRAYKVGRMHFLSFSYKPTKTGFTLSAITGMPSAYAPGTLIAGSVASSTTAADTSRGIAAYMVSGGAIGITTGTVPDYSLQFTFTWIA